MREGAAGVGLAVAGMIVRGSWEIRDGRCRP